MENKPYELIDHTADIGIRVKAKDLRDLFKHTALAMFDIIAEPKNKTVHHQQKIKIEQTADNLDELLINWLNELLSLSATKELIFSDFPIDTLDEHSLNAVAVGNNIRDYKVNVEIKAATYHELKIQKIESGYQAEVIFDV